MQRVVPEIQQRSVVYLDSVDYITLITPEIAFLRFRYTGGGG